MSRIDETVEEIEEMRTHSSSIVAVKATRALEELLDREYATVEEFGRTVERNANVLRQANPSHATLQNALREVVRTVTESDAETVATAKSLMEDTINRVVSDVERGKELAAEEAATYLEDGGTFMTHDYSSTVLEAITIAIEQGAEFEMYVTEAGPRHLGRKMARELATYDAIETHLITDSASGHFLSECDGVLLGMTCIVEEVLYNRIGTFPMVASADQVDVPVTVVGSGAKIISDGFAFKNEFRSPSEVMREPVEGFTIENPAYDATPLSLVDTIITDTGVLGDRPEDGSLVRNGE